MLEITVLSNDKRYLHESSLAISPSLRFANTQILKYGHCEAKYSHRSHPSRRQVSLFRCDASNTYIILIGLRSFTTRY